MFNIIERLSLPKQNILICIQKSSSQAQLENEIRSKGYHILIHRFKFVKSFSVTAFFDAIKFFRTYKIDVWQSFDWSSDYLEPLLARFSGAKYVYVKKGMNWGKTWKVKSLLSHAIIARNSTMMKLYFNNLFFKKKSRFITGAVDHEKFQPSKTKEYKYRSEGDNQFIIACIANIIPLKGQDFLIHALAKCPKNFALWIVGPISDLSFYEKLSSLINDLSLQNAVKFWGPTGSVAEFLNEADVYVLPTTLLGGHEEGCPVSLLEAMAVAVPCIATDVSGSRDLIKNEVNGFLVKPESEMELASKLQFLYMNPEIRLKFGLNGRQTILSYHLLNNEATQFEKVYTSFLK
jgi:glycosyltransferase involved in cell wall biosynthesis